MAAVRVSSGYSTWLALPLLVASCSGASPEASAPPAQPTSAAPMPPAPVIPTPHAGVSKELPIVKLPLRTPVSLAGAPGVTATLSGYIIEEIAPAPGDADSYPAGSGVVMSIAVGGHSLELSDLSEGYESAPVAWSGDYRITLVSHDSSRPSVDVHIEKLTDITESALHKKARVRLGESIALTEQLEAVFTSHGHRMVPRGRRSPLMVGMTYQTPSQELDSPIHSIDPPEASIWSWRDYRFRLLAHEYNSFMDLEVSRLRLEALEAE